MSNQLTQNLPGLWVKDENGLSFNLHSGQIAVWETEARFPFILAGTQSGKTSFLPWWLAREIGRTADPSGRGNDYIAVTATYDLFKLKFLPEMLNTFEGVTNTGRYWHGDRVIELRDPTTGEFWAKRSDKPMWGRIILRAASSGGGLESASARGAIADECGLPEFDITTWEALLRRLSLQQGRVLAGTTLYDISWIKTEVYDRWKRIDTAFEKPGDRDFQIITFDSTENPVFAVEEFERARQSMPLWRFNMMYRGTYTRPAGQIYDCFIDSDTSESGHRMRPRPLPAEWHRVAGIDFGVINTCVGFYAVQEDEDGYPTGKLILTRTYHAGSRNAGEHVEKIREIEPNLMLVTGGAASEDQWRRAYLWAGMPIYAPAITDVEVGIDAVYGATKQGKLLVFDTEQEFIQQKKNYSRKLDDKGEPTLEIKDKEKYHRLDQERYLTALMCSPSVTFLPFVPRKHLLVREAAKRSYPAFYTRFGGLVYHDGAVSSFVLCAIDTEGTVITEKEIIAPGLVGSDFAESIVKLLTSQGMTKEQVSNVLVVANDDLFQPVARGDLNGPAIAEAFQQAGLTIVKAGGDGVNEWSLLTEWLNKDAIRINRNGCPFLALTIPLITADVKDTSKPESRNPLVAAQALCNALMSRPSPSTEPVVEKPKQHERKQWGAPSQGSIAGTRR